MSKIVRDTLNLQVTYIGLTKTCTDNTNYGYNVALITVRAQGCLLITLLKKGLGTRLGTCIYHTNIVHYLNYCMAGIFQECQFL